MKKMSFAFALVVAVSLAACGGKSKPADAPAAGGDTYGAPAEAAPAEAAPAEGEAAPEAAPADPAAPQK
jgi:hypothetical protein